MMLVWLINWRTGLWIGLLVLVALNSFVPQMAGPWLAGWWVEEQRKGASGWQVVRRAVSWPRWWSRVYRAYEWARAGLWLGLSLWLVGHLLRHATSPWAWVCLAVSWQVTAREIRWLLLDWAGTRLVQAVEVSTVEAADEGGEAVEVTVDLAPLLDELGDLSPTHEVTTTAREALTARLERIRAECFQHPISQLLLQQIDQQVQHLVKRLVEEALVKELDEYLGFGRYERTGAAKPNHQHRSGGYSRSLRTAWGPIWVRVPKLRAGNKDRPWQVLERYERSFGPWLDTQLHLYRLGLSQADLQEILHLSFGQVLSLKAIEHLTEVARKEMEALYWPP